MDNNQTNNHTNTPDVNTTKAKYKINYFKLFLMLITGLIFLVVIYGLIAVPNAKLKNTPFMIFVLVIIILPALKSIANGIVTREEMQDDTENQ